MIVALKLLFISLLFALGIISSLTDILFGKIPNKILLCFFFLGIFFHFLSFLFGENFPISIFFNLVFSILVSFFLFYFNIWAAGDGKLFILYSFLIPLSFYPKKQIFPYFPSFLLLKNLFLPILIFALIETLKIASKNFQKFKKDFFSFLEAKNLFKIFFIILFLRLIWFLISIKNISFKIFLFDLKNLIFVSLIFWLFQAWFQFYTLNCGIKRVKIEKLKEEVEIPKENENEAILKILGKEKERKIRLSKKDIEKIKIHFKEKEILVYTTFPFAPFLFISMIITIWQTLKFW
jgi:hypothetical protein